VLVIVTGAPAAGKSTLAARLGVALQLPVLMKDTIKEALLDTLGAPSRERSRDLSRASYAVLAAMAGAVLVSGTGAVVEANYRRGTSEPELHRLLPHGRGVQVHCAARRDVIERRYRERTEAGLRHRGHFDAQMLPEVLTWLDDGLCDPLDLNVPLVRVDTNDGYQPSFETVMAIVEQVRRA
jgi:predicted kinase